MKKEDLEKYQLLCINCNCCDGNFGICSHKLKLENKNCCVICDNYLNNENRIDFNINNNYNICNICMIDINKKSIIINYEDKITKKQYRLSVKNNIINNYGGKCACCGETDPLFLTIDHINGGGRKEGRGSIDLYLKLISENYPKDKYQLLCYNCNCSKSHYGKNEKCYHQLLKDQQKDIITIEDYKELIRNNIV